MVPSQYDPYSAYGGFGSYGMKRAKRDGRNPSTGARTSRPYGQVILFLTGYLPLQAGDSNPIY